MNQSTDFHRSHELLSVGRSRLLIVDVQEKFVPHISGAARVIEGCRRLLTGAKILDVPAVATEQYPKGLGPTVSPLADFFEDRPDKLRFSAAELLPWSLNEDDEQTRDQIVIAGIETHICILQTAFDLMERGLRVFIVADAVSSRSTTHHELALKRLRDGGAVITTTESVLFEWCEVAGTDTFKQISQLVREPLPE
ncbi:hydrolase [Thalassoroseus pseudoceratinae]|uniref:hydrolase n=1 Tax=Thalassoroseus pseudoceratinae TaxID=2713176 RepID=UPI001F0E25AA|nr:hydrolase [Thalassoroseus pseudoceratinae]